MAVHDIRNSVSPVKILELNSGPNVNIPIYDAETKMLFLYSKGEDVIEHYEILHNSEILRCSTYRGTMSLSVRLF